VDVETAHAEEGSRFGRILAALVGLAALVAALLGALQMDASTRGTRAQSEAARLSVSIFEGLAVQGLVSSFQLGSLQRAIVPSAESIARSIEGLDSADVAPFEDALAAAYAAAADRMLAVARDMSVPPGPDDGTDPHTQQVFDELVPDLSVLFDAVASGEPPEQSPEEIAALGREGLDRMVKEQNRQVDLANVYGSRSNRTVFALSILALAAVLLALAGVTGEGSTGRVAMWSGAVALLAAIAAGASALFI
jgi:hypothetical protein